MKDLMALYQQHQGKVSDKWSLYLAEYDRLFSPYRDQPIRLLEIGVQNGGSLEIWSQYFAKAERLVGCDIDPGCERLRYEDPRIAVVVGDANTDQAQAAIQAHSAQFDLIIDDGSHTSSDIVRSFARYFPALREGGLFIAEDLHCSYWQEFEGGLYDPYSSIAFFKRLADVVNHEHWGIQSSRGELLEGFQEIFGISFAEDLLASIHSVQFINSICVVRKDAVSRVELGPRFIAGQLEEVVPGHPELHRSATASPSQADNAWSTLPRAPDELWLEQVARTDAAEGRARTVSAQAMSAIEQAAAAEKKLEHSQAQLKESQEQLAQLQAEKEAMAAQMAQLGQTVHDLMTSTSWRISAPVRTLGVRSRQLKTLTGLGHRLVRQHGAAGVWRKLEKVVREEGVAGLRSRLRPQITAEGGNDYAEWVRRFDTLDDAARTAIGKQVAQLADAPVISVVMPTYNPDLPWLRQAIDSVRAQLYPHWELCIADDASTDPAIRPVLEEYARNDARIRVVFRESNGHISAASNTALGIATGEWVALLDQDDVLPEHALYLVAREVIADPSLRLIYSDEDKIDQHGTRYGPYFKCDWNRDLFYSHNMICHLGVYHRAIMEEIGGFREGFNGAQDYDLALRFIERIDESAIRHIPRVLYHWRAHAGSTAGSADAKPYAMLAGERAINDHFARLGVKGRVELIGHGYRPHYELPDPPPLVSIVIPTRNAHELVRQCLESIRARTDYPHYEVVLVDNGSDDPVSVDYFAGLEQEDWITVVRDDRPFNYSALNNLGVSHARGSVLALLNNDIEVITESWLTELVSQACREDIGAVGAKLLYPNDTLQHAGIICGIGGWAGHSHKGHPRDTLGYSARASLVSNFSAVTGACLVIRKALFLSLGGLNETDLKVACNDVDLCLKARAAGLRNLWTPYAELYHHESATRGFEDNPVKQARFASEVAYMQQCWGPVLANDPAYSPNLTLASEDFSLAWPPRVGSLV
jgi:glycosyltransferase involved in cell wall biosynthesis/SAM-dependent methyltransferase